MAFIFCLFLYFNPKQLFKSISITNITNVHHLDNFSANKNNHEHKSQWTSATDVQSCAAVKGALSALPPYWWSHYTGLQCSVTGPYHMPQFYDLCSSPNIIRVMWWAGQVAHMWKKRNLYTAFMRKPEGRSLLGKPNCRLVSSVSGYRKVVSFCEHGDKTLGCINVVNFATSWTFMSI